jgi:hypothetical protein
MVAALVLLVACGAHHPVPTVRDVLAAPDRFANVDVVMTGQVGNPRFRSPERGNSYTTFTLADGTGSVLVFGWGKLDIDNGDIVEVRGTFRRAAQAGSDTLDDAVEVAFLRRLRAAVPLTGPSGVP